MREINTLQRNIILYCKEWAIKENKPIPQKSIILQMKEKGVKSFTALNAINALLTKGYLRRGYSERANVSVYVLIRNVRDPD